MEDRDPRQGEARGVDQDQACDPLGMVQGELERDPATHGVADQDGLGEAQFVQQGANESRVIVDRADELRKRRLAVAGKVGGEHAEIGLEAAHLVEPDLAGAARAVNEHERGAFARGKHPGGDALDDPFLLRRRSHARFLPIRFYTIGGRASRIAPRAPGVVAAGDLG
ncbi:hypothetical protein D3C72_1566740 [compost metagenome]